MEITGVSEEFTVYVNNEKGVIISLKPANCHSINLFWHGEIESHSYERAEEIDVEKVLY